ncbi:unnamed protein product [Rotaria socialis]|nr:unnamed protein product [Rotaria socialis]
MSTATCQCSSIDYWNNSYCVALLYPGQTCTSSSQCINASSCISSICQCNTNYYYSTLTGQCTYQLSYSSTCTLGNYQCLNNTLCYDLRTSPTGTCACDSTYYYYDGTSCTAYATYGATCAAATYGPICDSVARSLQCIGSQCSCSSTTYYNSSSCVSYTHVGFSCTTSSQCVTNSNCSSGICTCLSTYYFDTTTGNCVTLLTYGQACTSSVQCPTNMLCTSSQCLCTSTTYYSSPNCVSRISYGGTCSLTILCDTTLGLVCTSSVCQCNSTQYWSTLSNGMQICANLRTLGQSCTASTDCTNSATSVTCKSSICECDSNAYYLDQATVTCQPLEALGVACTATYNFECASFNCNASNVCGTAISSTIKSNVSQASSESCLRRPHNTMFLRMIGIYLFFFEL